MARKDAMDGGEYGLIVDHESLERNIKANWRGPKDSMMIWGPPGIGKSQLVIKSAQKLAEMEKREFLNLNAADKGHMVEAMENPAEFFIFIDKRLGSMDMTDLSGTPFQDKENQWTQ